MGGYVIIPHAAGKWKRVPKASPGIGWKAESILHRLTKGGSVTLFSEKRTTSRQEACSDANGTMPSCAPLAVPYVPFQQNGAIKYSQTDALNNGTLFPGLNLPFKAKATGRNVVDNALSELQALEFVVAELNLYLDTHSDDTEAFELFKQYSAMEAEARKKYEETYGPLTLSAAAAGDKYNWLTESWPWNYPETKGGAK